MQKVILDHPINEAIEVSIDHAKRLLERPNNGGGWFPKTEKDAELLGLSKPKKEKKKHGVGAGTNTRNTKKSAEKSTKISD